MKVLIHGAGYTGLTVGIHYAQAGHLVAFYDPNKTVVDAIKAGTPRAGDFLSYLNADVKRLVETNQIDATHEWSRDEVGLFDAHVICVPTERAGMPDDSIVLSLLDRLSRDARQGAVICIDSTLSPGTTDKALAMSPTLLARTLGATIKRDLVLAVTPRRDWFADPKKNVATLPRVVGGLTKLDTILACDLLKTITPPHLLQKTTYQTAEIVKALENAMLHSTVMLLHEVAMLLPDHDIAEAIDLASTHWRFESMRPLYLGFGSGGRCVPLGTEYLLNAIGLDEGHTRLGKSSMLFGARDTDTRLTHTIARSVHDRLKHLARPTVLVLGIAYRPEFKDAGRSPALRLVKIMQEMGLRVIVDDPLWEPEELAQLCECDARDPSERNYHAYDAVLLVTPHNHYAYDEMLNDDDQIARDIESMFRRGQFVLDGSGIWSALANDLARYGVTYRQIGKPGWLDA